MTLVMIAGTLLLFGSQTTGGHRTEFAASLFLGSSLLSPRGFGAPLVGCEQGLSYCYVTFTNYREDGMRRKDLTGQTFGRLTVLGYAESRRDKHNVSHRYVKCRCDCGKVGEFSANGVATGNSQSCGCNRRGPYAIEDLSGSVFGKLTVIGFDGVRYSAGRGRLYYLCACDCGTVRAFLKDCLTRRHTLSCGCHQRLTRFTHGGTKTREYAIWVGMKSRCTSEAHDSYKYYGGRGITVCERWLHSFENFLADMGKAPTTEHTLDRIDSNGNYESGNCRWATRKAQSNNMRRNKILEYRGEKHTVTQWADRLGISRAVIYERLNKLGWSAERALITPTGKYNRRTIAA